MGKWCSVCGAGMRRIMRWTSSHRSLWGVLAFATMPLLAVGTAFFPPRITRPPDELTPGGNVPQHLVLLPDLLATYATVDQGLSHIAGASRDDKEDFDRGFLSRVYQDSGGVSPITIPLDPEALLLLHPDASVVQEFLLPTLAAVGLPRLLPYRYDPSLSARLALWSQLGSLSGHAARAAQLRTHFLETRHNLEALIGTRQERPKVAFFIGGSRTGLGFLYGRILHLNELIESVGAINVSQNFVMRTVPTPENLAMLDPDVIYLGSDLDSENTPQTLYLSTAWQIVRAVREKKVYRLPPSHFFAPVLDENLLLQWFAETLYPDLPRAVRSSYRQEFYRINHVTLTDDDLDKLLSLQQNAMSCGYERFARTAYAVR